MTELRPTLALATLLALVACACGADVRVGSEHDEDALTRYCQARCDHDERCEDGNREQCMAVCTDPGSRVRRGLRSEYLDAIASCFESLDCAFSDDSCQDILVEVEEDPALRDACEMCELSQDRCDRAQSFNAAVRNEMIECLLDSCQPACIRSLSF